LSSILSAAVPRVDDGPLVSIIVPTYNRRDRILETLRRLSGQTYKNIEVVVVNDGGVAIDDIVGQFQFARLITLAENKGVTAAANTAMEAVAGEYVGFLADDDELFPDHISRLMFALRQNIFKVAHSNQIIRLREPDGRGGFRTYGHLLGYDGFLDRSELLWSMAITFQGLLIRRSVFEEIGFFDLGLSTGSDYELMLRLGMRHDYLHVDHVTGIYNYAPKAATLANAARESVVAELQVVYDRYPVSDRPLVQERRRIQIQTFQEQIAAGDYWPVPLRIDSSDI